ncbi:MAG TPA: hypothetical protein VMT22_00475 [Terriglobales bacterium]|nr:hypothetical protein [Terriglobales bacterium]
MKKSRRVLLYGFGPYKQFRDNITAKIIKSLPRQPGLRKIVFPVRFDRRQFVESLGRFKPDVIVGLGQSSRRRIEVESQAKNRRRSSKAKRARAIAHSSGPTRLKTTLQLKLGRQAGRSENAGDYVCNFSMYVILAELRRKGGEVPYGFIHIPHDCDWMRAKSLVVKIIRQCQRG